ncbi:hypothetical protein GLIP_0262 [Aliiglaciecola lipolytica E3]|uniref:Uncharacterized protein n=1 Tax=Aliiglaciecola lipolytica E3 TaxID=1127673 RepID=K6XML7_9ALTE|nr:hypothetical protein GLIP_0262 [Aliiglaciecola lipolytica E3]
MLINLFAFDVDSRLKQTLIGICWLRDSHKKARISGLLIYSNEILIIALQRQ